MNRRSLLLGLGAFVATAPAIVRAASLMPVRAPKLVARLDACHAVPVFVPLPILANRQKQVLWPGTLTVRVGLAPGASPEELAAFNRWVARRAAG